MEILQVFIEKSLSNYNYIAYSKETKRAIHFDPFDIDQTLPVSNRLGLNVEYLVNTHHHFDHIKDNENLLQQTACDLVTLSNGERLYLSDDEYIEAIHTPGHVADHFCYLISDKSGAKGLISGDMVFNSGVGHCRLGGNVKELFVSVRDIILRLPEHLILYPSHDYMLQNLRFAKTVEPKNKVIDEYIKRYEEEGAFLVTLEEEKLYNPFLRVFNEDLIREFDGLNSEDIFYKLRSLRDKW